MAASTHLTREDISHMFFLDCPTEMCWKNWAPGGEYTKQLIIHNTGSKAQEIRYKLPTSRNFYMEFPAPIMLASGMACALDVKFRPLVMEDSFDHIEIITPRGNFQVSVAALVGRPHISLPTFQDLVFCPINEVTRRSFTITNDGDLDLTFAWTVSSPYAIVPSRGELGVGESAELELQFTPRDASVHVATAVCRASTGDAYSMKLSGIGKYPHITVPDTVLDFGQVHTGTKLERSIPLKNNAVVPATFKIVPSDPESVTDSVFTFRPIEGVVPAESTMLISVIYHPTATGSFSSQHFDIITPGGNALKLRCTGLAVGPQVSISPRTINFGDVDVSKLESAPESYGVRRVLTVHNNGDEASAVQLYLDSDDCIQLSESRALIQPRSQHHFNITFAPRQCSNFWKTLYVLIGHSSPLCVDLIGTGFDAIKRPAPFTMREIEVYRARRQRRVGNVPPEELERLLGPEAASASLTGEDIQLQSILDIDEASARDSAPKGLDLFSAFTADVAPNTVSINGSIAADLSLAKLDSSFVDFNSVPSGMGGDRRTVTLTNNTAGKLSCFWVEHRSSPHQPRVFVVQPAISDIPPFGQVTFTVTFLPPADAMYYAHNLQCVTFFKSMRTFRLVAPYSFVPPNAINLLCFGNSFPASSEQFAGRGSLDLTRINFPSSSVGRPVYQSVVLRNHGETPMLYNIEIPPVVRESRDSFGDVERRPEQPFSVAPSAGVVPARSFQVLVFRFSPQDSYSYVSTARCILNNAVSRAIPIRLSGIGCKPALEMPDGDQVFFKPTLLTTSSSRTFTIKNPSKIPSLFQFDIPSKYRGIASVEPAAGVLRGNESTEVRFTFAPQTVRQYQIRIKCKISSVSSGNGSNGGSVYSSSSAAASSNNGMDDSVAQIITLVGEGWLGGVRMSPDVVEFGTVLIGRPDRKEVTIFNDADCDLDYNLISELLVPATSGEGDNQNGVATVDQAYFDSARAVEKAAQLLIIDGGGHGIIPARTSISVAVEFRPTQRTHYSLRLTCFTSVAGSGGAGAAASRTQQLSLLGNNGGNNMETLARLRAVGGVSSEVTGVGAYPVTQISDVRSVFPPTSKNALWQRLSIQSINHALLQLPSAPSSSASSPSYSKRNYRSFKEMEASLEHFDVDLGAAAIGSAPTNVQFRFTNVGLLPVDFSFLFPDFSEVEVMKWIDPEERSETDKRHTAILDHKLITVEPSAGKLHANESMVVTVTYAHTYVDTHQLPVLFRIKDGVEMALQLRGRTLSADEKFIECATLPTQLVPVEELRQNEQVVRLHLGFPASQLSHTPEAPAPVRYIQLQNPGTVDLQYSVDLSSIRRLCDEQYGYQLLRLPGIELAPSSPSSPSAAAAGDESLDVELFSRYYNLAAGETCYLPVQLCPLELKTYACLIPIVVTNGNTLILEVIAEPMSSELPPASEQDLASSSDILSSTPAPDIPKMLALVPSQPKLFLNGQPGILTPESLNLGPISSLSVHRRVVIITNPSKEDRIGFSWNVMNEGPWSLVPATSALTTGASIVVEPAAGELAPGASISCRVLIRAGALPQVLDADLSVTLTNLRLYNEELRLLQTSSQRNSQVAVADEIMAVHGDTLSNPTVREFSATRTKINNNNSAAAASAAAAAPSSSMARKSVIDSSTMAQRSTTKNLANTRREMLAQSSHGGIGKHTSFIQASVTTLLQADSKSSAAAAAASSTMRSPPVAHPSSPSRPVTSSTPSAAAMMYHTLHARIQACILPISTFTSVYPAPLFKSSLIPAIDEANDRLRILADEPNIALVQSMDPQALIFVQGIVQDMLRQIVRGDSTFGESLYTQAADRKIPYYILSKPDWTLPHVAQQQEQEQQSEQEEGAVGGEEAQASSPSSSPAVEAVPVAAAAADANANVVNTDQVEKTVNSSSFQSAVESMLEDSLFSLMADAISGAFNVAQPRRVVRVVSKKPGANK